MEQTSYSATEILVPIVVICRRLPVSSSETSLSLMGNVAYLHPGRFATYQRTRSRERKEPTCLFLRGRCRVFFSAKIGDSNDHTDISYPSREESATEEIVMQRLGDPLHLSLCLRERQRIQSTTCLCICMQISVPLQYIVPLTTLHSLDSVNSVVSSLLSNSHSGFRQKSFQTSRIVAFSW